MTLIRALLIALLLCPHSLRAQSFVLPSFDQVRSSHASSDALLLDRKGVPLADLRLNPQVRRLDWVPLAHLSPAMRDALLRAEDRRFFKHGGVDWLAFAGAAWQNLWGSGKRGASTLTMQLAGLLDPALRMPANRRSVAQKWDQSRAAIELEARWSKAQILEAYLNLAPFRGDLQGIAAASELLFGLPANALSVREASLLAALLRGPNASPSLVAKRACRLAASLSRTAHCTAITQLAQSRLNASRAAPRYHLAPHLAKHLLLHPGQRISSMLDAALQTRLLGALTPEDDPQTAVLVLDNSSGEVLAWIGARDPRAADGVTTPHRLPDGWWPFAAALAIEQREVTAASPLPLGSLIFDARDAHALPDSWVSLRSALLIRQPAALLDLLHTKLDHTLWLERLRMLELDTGLEADFSSNLLQLAAAWSSLASGGLWQMPRWTPGQEQISRRIWRPETSFILQHMLNQNGPGSTQASWSSLSTEGIHLIVGHQDRYTLALASRTPSATSLWQRLTIALSKHAGKDSRPPALPEGVVCNEVQFEPPLESARRECFLRGTELDLVTVLPKGQQGRIMFPHAGQVYDVSASGKLQDRLLLQAESSVALQWSLNGHPLGTGQLLLWQAVAGLHRLSIHDPRERLLHSIEFEVRTTP